MDFEKEMYNMFTDVGEDIYAGYIKERTITIKIDKIPSDEDLCEWVESLPTKLVDLLDELEEDNARYGYLRESNGVRVYSHGTLHGLVTPKRICKLYNDNIAALSLLRYM
jgi:hypothetical protein